jgi:hypothetical protein
MTLLPKPSRTARKLQTRGLRSARLAHEQREKAKVRKRDKGCRFPMCGCRRLGLRIEVSHDRHKGMGGNPACDRSDAADMVQLCEHRHQHSQVSRHKGTLRSVPLSHRGYDGPVEWWVRLDDDWRLVAIETAAGVLGTCDRGILDELAKMTL